MIKWRRPQEPATGPGREAPSRSEGSSRDVSGEQGRLPPAVPAPAPAAVLLLMGLAGCLNTVLDMWLRPHGIGWSLLMLASVAVALATGRAEQVSIMPPRPAPVTWLPAELSLLCWLRRDRDHEPCSGTRDDGTGLPCECYCHHPWPGP